MAYLGAIGKLHESGTVTHGGVIKGVVHDAGGNPVERVVMAINKQTHVITGARSRSSDGQYTIYTPFQLGQAEHIVVEISSDPAYNARVHSQVLPDNNGI